ncbi:MAG: hypothetical protein Q9209_005848 [Squamulea sp. 1 TL-2023]
MADPTTCQRASAALTRTLTTAQVIEATPPPNPRLPPISEDRLRSSLDEQDRPGHQPLDPSLLQDASKQDETYLYLAYGSNLASSTFRGVRGIQPLAALNVVVPELVMTFDLPGLPYTEPCFANTAYRTPSSSPSNFSLPQVPRTQFSDEEKTPLLPTYTNPHWPKGLVGVVYEVTPQDFAHIIATEGGGASYHDVLVTCHPLSPTSDTVPSHPNTPPFKAHTLYSPISPPGTPPPKDGNRFQRPDPSYAQPSKRYINLITTGASEHALPQEYRDYLDELQPYTITTQGQRIGRFVFMMTWMPIIRAVFGLNKTFSDERGRSPGWLVRLLGWVFAGVWVTYDGWMKGVFGDGERTIEDEGKEGRRRLVKRRREVVVGEKEGWVGERERV